MIKNKLLIALISLFCSGLQAQDDLMEMLEEEQGETTEYAFATFKGTRMINLQSPELPAEGVLQYMFNHRFGAFNNDFFYNFLGMSNAEVRLQLDYSFKDWLNVGLGHGSATPRTYDAFVKYRLARQSKGAKNFPFTLSGYSAVFCNYQRTPEDALYNTSDRFSFVNELVIARKVTSDFSVSLVPTHVHFNLVSSMEESNDLFSVGFGGRYKITQSISVNAEYILQLNPLESRLQIGTPEIPMQNNRNVFSLGMVAETGGHVFQLFLTNSRGVSDPYVIAQTPGSWLDGDIHFGFNISRVFTLKRPEEFQDED